MCAGYLTAAQDCGHELDMIGSPAIGCVPTTTGDPQKTFEFIAGAICAGG